MCDFISMVIPPCVEFEFYLVQFKALKTLHFYDINIFCLVDSLSCLKRKALLTT